jgi:hypothetical protein
MSGFVLVCVVIVTGCQRAEPDVPTLATDPAVGASVAQQPAELDQYGTAQALQDCLVEAGIPAELTPVDGGEAQIDWATGHEVLARDHEQTTTVLEGPAGEVDEATLEAFAGIEESPGRRALAG